jgi:hypothetical protein
MERLQAEIRSLKGSHASDIKRMNSTIGELHAENAKLKNQIRRIKKDKTDQAIIVTEDERLSERIIGEIVNNNDLYGDHVRQRRWTPFFYQPCFCALFSIGEGLSFLESKKTPSVMIGIFRNDVSSFRKARK